MEVNVTVSPERNGSFIEGDNVTLTCTGVNPPDAVLRDLTFWWTGQLNNTESDVNLTNGDEGRGITVKTTGNTSTLSIMNIQDEKRIEGNYTCRVFNRILNDVVEVTTEISVICEMCVYVLSVCEVIRCTCGRDVSSWDGWRRGRESGEGGEGWRRKREEGMDEEDEFCMYRLSAIPVQLVQW